MFTQKRNYQNSLWLVVRLQCNLTVLYLRWSHNKKLKVLTAGLQKLTIWYTESRIYTKTKKQMSVFFCCYYSALVLPLRCYWPVWSGTGLLAWCWTAGLVRRRSWDWILTDTDEVRKYTSRKIYDTGDAISNPAERWASVFQGADSPVTCTSCWKCSRSFSKSVTELNCNTEILRSIICEWLVIWHLPELRGKKPLKKTPCKPKISGNNL